MKLPVHRVNSRAKTDTRVYNIVLYAVKCTILCLDLSKCKGSKILPVFGRLRRNKTCGLLSVRLWPVQVSWQCLI